ncbi:hypothetical protein W822_18120 [Advenella kashmirensis W13003]|uniref:Uncharacterized protein n=1 Tax=Advenella kashmirensis W13003 TaxID=1424334 RepID=V8QQ13_9BURK|nr:hypothetical protein W822_18120 [Advenella kashmirensis W13003]
MGTVAGFYPGGKFEKRDCNVFASIWTYLVVFSDKKKHPQVLFQACAHQGVARRVQFHDQ